MKYMKSAFKFPYVGKNKIYLFQLALSKIFPRYSFPAMNLIPKVMKFFAIDSMDEFRVRYYLSRLNHVRTWTSKDRSNKEAVESHYNEQDFGIWRQAMMSKGLIPSKTFYKRKILRAYHIARSIGSRVALDYGCGAGAVANYLKNKGLEVDVADVVSPTLDFVRKSIAPRTVFTITSKLKLPNNAYDLISCLDVLEHTFDPVETTHSLIQSLRKGGALYVIFPKDDVAKACGGAHTREAQLARPATFEYLRTVCDEMVPESIYIKR